MTATTAFFVVGVAGHELVASERRILRAYPPGGILLFARNVGEEGQLRALVASLRAAIPGVLLFVDQEGGPVDRFRALFGQSPSLAAAAESGFARAAGELAGEMCAIADVDVDLAPVVDRAVAEASARVLSGRCAAEEPEAVALAAEEFIGGLSEFGVASCLKHFPGLGRATVDSHLELPAVEVEETEDALDLLPFRMLRERSPAVTISHAAVRGTAMPATLDPSIATTLLREEVAFGGLAISDDLEMGALERFGDLAARSAAAFKAGCDLLCVASKLEELPHCAEAIAPAAASPRGEEARRRMERFRRMCADIRHGNRRRPRAARAVASAAAELIGRAGKRLSG